MRGHASGRVALALVATGVGWIAPPTASAFCELMFKDVAAAAPIVVLAQYEASRAGEPQLLVVEVLKGSTTAETLGLGEADLAPYRPERGDLFLLALTRTHTLVQAVPGMGVCLPHSVLAIRHGKVRASDRGNWDGSGDAPPLERLRQEIRSAP